MYSDHKNMYYIRTQSTYVYNMQVHAKSSYTPHPPQPSKPQKVKQVTKPHGQLCSIVQLHTDIEDARCPLYCKFCAEDSINCGLSFLMEAPVLEEMNISFESLSEPLLLAMQSRCRCIEVSNCQNLAVTSFSSSCFDYGTAIKSRWFKADGTDIFHCLWLWKWLRFDPYDGNFESLAFSIPAVLL